MTTNALAAPRGGHLERCFALTVHGTPVRTELRPDGRGPARRTAGTGQNGSHGQGPAVRLGRDLRRLAARHVEHDGRHRERLGRAGRRRTGLTAVAVLFLPCQFTSPLARSVPGDATAPALCFVACLMLRDLVEWGDSTAVIPAAVTAPLMPFTHAIANGRAFGCIPSGLLQPRAGRARAVHRTVWRIGAVFLCRFVYVGGH